MTKAEFKKECNRLAAELDKEAKSIQLAANLLRQAAHRAK